MVGSGKSRSRFEANNGSLYYLYDNESLGYDYNSNGSDDFGQTLKTAEKAAILSSMEATMSVD